MCLRISGEGCPWGESSWCSGKIIKNTGIVMAKRFLTAIIGMPAIFFIVSNKSQFIFFLFILMIIAMALKEFFSMALPDESQSASLFLMILGCLIPVSVFYEANSGIASIGGISSIPMGVCVLVVTIIFFYHILFSPKVDTALNQISIKILGIFYVALLFSYVILLRLKPEGVELVFFLICITWAGDTGAYMLGTWKGKRALSPAISPNKTIEGAMGSTVSGIVIAVVFKMFFLCQLSLIHCIVLAVGINVMNQFGDLSESLIKRTFNAKDTGNVFPGHGGVLDRIDSFLFAAPFLFYYIKIVLP